MNESQTEEIMEKCVNTIEELTERVSKLEDEKEELKKEMEELKKSISYKNTEEFKKNRIESRKCEEDLIQEDVKIEENADISELSKKLK